MRRVGIEIQPPQQIVAIGLVHPTGQIAQQPQDLQAGQLRPQRDITGDVTEVPVRARDVIHRDTHHPRPAGVRMDQMQQQPDRGGLPGTVGTEEPEHLAPLDHQVKPIQCQDVAEALGQPLRTNRRRNGHSGLLAPQPHARPHPAQTDTDVGPMGRHLPDPLSPNIDQHCGVGVLFLRTGRRLPLIKASAFAGRPAGPQRGDGQCENGADCGGDEIQPESVGDGGTFGQAQRIDHVAGLEALSRCHARRFL